MRGKHLHHHIHPKRLGFIGAAVALLLLTLSQAAARLA